MNLHELFQLYGTDKATLGYAKHYERYLEPTKVKLLVEIGVEAGNSLRAWGSWLPNATVVGVDLNLPSTDLLPNNVRLWKGDGTSPDLARQVVETFGRPDVVVDDGSHKWGEQRRAFEAWWPYIKPGGWHVVEDLHTSFDPRWGNKESEMTAVEWLGELTEHVHGTSWVKPKEHSTLMLDEVHCHNMICFLKKRGLK